MKNMNPDPFNRFGSILMPPNKYGYRVNILHPAVLPLYKRYHKWKGIPQQFPLSDAERFEFEDYIIKLINERGKIN